MKLAAVIKQENNYRHVFYAWWQLVVIVTQKYVE